jgi:hypothetical protein
MIETIDEFFDKVGKNLTFKETIDFENQFNTCFSKGCGKFNLVADTLYKNSTPDIDFVYVCEMPLTFKSAALRCEYYGKVIPEKSNVKVKWRLPTPDELSVLLYDTIVNDFYGVPVDSHEYFKKIDEWCDALFWTNEIFLNKKDSNVVNCLRVECVNYETEFYIRKPLNIAFKEELVNENQNVYTILVGEVIENV